jgi:DNA-binding MarR family transcriptional regulator
VSRRTLELLRRQQSAPGWAIAKTLGMDPAVVSKALEDLRYRNLIDTESGSGLDGFYFLTGLAYKLMGQTA